MRAVIYNRYSSGILASSDSLTIRCAFLVAEELTIAGDIYFFTDFENFMKADTLKSVLMANHFMHIFLGELPEIPIEEQMQMLKNYNKIKSKSGEGIAMFKRLEKSSRELFYELKKEVIEKLDKHGLSKLHQLLKNDFLFAVTPNHSNHEKEDKVNFFTPVSRMLSLEETYQTDSDQPNLDMEPVFFLQTEFICNIPEVFNNYEHLKELVQPKPAKSYTLLNFPNLNYASAQELAVLRNNFFPLLQSFYKLVNEWIKLVKNGSGNATHFMCNSLLPECTRVQSILDKDELIEYLRRVDKSEGVASIVAGECRFDEIWKFYNSVGCVPEETLPVLEKLKQGDKKFTSFQPFLSINFKSNKNRKTDPTVSDDIISVKKNLSLD